MTANESSGSATDSVTASDQHDVSGDAVGHAASYDDWLALAQQSLAEDTSLAGLARQTLDGPSIATLYTDRPDATDQIDIPRLADGIDNRVRVRADSIDVRRQQIAEALEGGATSLELPMPDPTQPLASLLADVYLDMAGVSLQAGEATATVARSLIDCWEERGIPAQAAIGEFNADPFASLVRQGWLRDSVDANLSAMARLADTARRYPGVTAVGIDTTVQHAAGASARLELIAAIATASVYLETLIASGLSPADSARQMVFRTAVDADYLMTVVKLRSLRRLWQHVTEHLQIDTAPARVTAVTASRQLSRREPWMNHLRHVSSTMAAVAGGADAVVVRPHNRVDGQWLDDEHALGDRMARNILLILQEESWMKTVRDPLAGAYAVEHLCDELCSSTWQGLQALQAEGGYLDALRRGDWQAQIATVSQQRREAVASGERVIVGVNRFVVDEASTTGDDLSPPASAAAPVDASVRITKLQPQRDAAVCGA